MCSPLRQGLSSSHVTEARAAVSKVLARSRAAGRLRPWDGSSFVKHEEVDFCQVNPVLAEFIGESALVNPMLHASSLTLDRVTPLRSGLQPSVPVGAGT